MADDEPLILNLAGAILDGEAPDWASLESDASDSQRAAFAELQAIAAIGSLSRHRPRLPHSAIDLPLSKSTTWGPLQILEPIGRGGFGTVYRAWDPQLDREVALKLLPADDEGVSALEEGRLLAKVHHPNVVTIFGADRIGASVGLWMEYVRGDTLEHILTREGAFTPSSVALIGRQLCEALAAVHQAGLVHRDVKAHNVMREPGGRLVLMDFGAGRMLSAGAQDVAGTPLYLAPEIFGGGAATALSDLYSVGVLLYHLLTTQYPIAGRTVREVRDAHARVTIAPLVRSARPDVPRRLAAAIEHALAVRPADRFQSAGQMAVALKEDTTVKTRLAQRVLFSLAAAATIVLLGAVTGVLPVASLQKLAFRPNGLAAIPADTPTARRLSLPDWTFAGSGLSYDGRYYSYVGKDTALVVLDMTTGLTDTLVPVSGEEFAQLSITSPDGSLIAYQWWTDRRSYEIRVVDRFTKQVRVLLRDDTLDYPMPIEWARDGSSILLWTKMPQGVGRIVVADVTTGALQTVREIPSDEPLGLSLSRDGRFIAYDLPVSQTNRARVLHLVDRASHRDRVIQSDTDAHDRFPLWTPDGEHVFFISDRSGSSDGWIVPVHDGVPAGEPTLAIRNLGRVSSLGLTETGAFYYRLRAGAFEVNEASLDPITMAPRSTKRVATRFAGSNIGPSYSRDGRQLAFISVREGLGGKPERTLVIRDSATGKERELNPAGGLGNAPARWSPDGTRLLVGSRIIDAVTGAELQSFNAHPDKDQTDYGPVRWEPEGRSVIYEQALKGLVRHPLTARSKDEVVYEYSAESPIRRIHRFEVSPDGHTIALSAFLKDGRGSVLEARTSVGSIELARRTQPEIVVVQGWSPDGQFVLFTTLNTTKEPPHDLWRVPVWGGPSERLGAINGGTQINPIAVNPIGTAIAYTTGSPLQELWMMENALPR